MKTNNPKIKEADFDINLSFYNFLKRITQAKLTENQINEFLSIYDQNYNQKIEILKDIWYEYIETKIKRNEKTDISEIVLDVDSYTIELFIYALKLNLIKKILLSEAKVVQDAKALELTELHKLSLAYDKTSLKAAYATRISAALLSSMFFKWLEKKDKDQFLEMRRDYLDNVAALHQKLKGRGLEAEVIFMPVFVESVNQSLRSTAGVSYEDRVKSVLIAMGIQENDIKKTHDKIDSSTEFDFFFSLDNKTYGIGAKRTLRERYKQFIKTGIMSKLDVMIEITLGTDLRENIANSIVKHGVLLFVADEAYDTKKYLQSIDGVYPASALTIELLKKLK